MYQVVEQFGTAVANIFVKCKTVKLFAKDLI